MFKLALLLSAMTAPASAGVDEISKCWMAGSTSTNTLRSTVDVVAVMNPDGSVASVQLISADGPTDAARRTAFETASRAIRRCAPNAPDFAGKTVRLRFDYNQMRITLPPDLQVSPNITDI